MENLPRVSIVCVPGKREREREREREKRQRINKELTEKCVCERKRGDER